MTMECRIQRLESEIKALKQADFLLREELQNLTDWLEDLRLKRALPEPGVEFPAGEG